MSQIPSQTGTLSAVEDTNTTVRVTLRGQAEDNPRGELILDLSNYSKISRESAGHLRHFHNLAWQQDGEWRHMGTQEPAQEFLDAFRYQLATMAYAAGAAHYHRLPALRSVFKTLMRQLIHKMLHRAVWGYWFTTSLSGTLVDPDLKELRKPWADPVVRENIMYSGHLLLMTSLYAMLFDDDEFEKPGSLVFHWNPIFFGFGPESFSYDNRSLQAAILAEMEKNGWVGVCCEPNLVFVVCNQFPLVAMRYNDSRDGTHVVEDVLEKYKAATTKKGMINKDGYFSDMWAVRRDTVIPARDIGWTAWASTFMNGWNSPIVHSGYEKRALGSIVSLPNEVKLNPPDVASAYRKLVEEGGAEPTDPATQHQAIAEVRKSQTKSKMPYTKPTYGYVVMWLSELGRSSELEGLLKYADKHLQPAWEEGGLFYRRNDTPVSEEYDWTHMDPFTGNAAIGYSRLNVLDGQKTMWEQPRTKRTLEADPWIGGVSLADGVDFYRGVWDSKQKALIATMKSWDSAKTVKVQPIAHNLEAGTWKVYVNGECITSAEIGGSKNSIEVTIEVGDQEVDVVFSKL